LDELEETPDGVIAEANEGLAEIDFDDPADALPPMDADDDALKAAADA
jgi:hypothetical protein